jgi:hypothetical protein
MVRAAMTSGLLVLSPLALTDEYHNGGGGGQDNDFQMPFRFCYNSWLESVAGGGLGLFNHDSHDGDCDQDNDNGEGD